MFSGGSNSHQVRMAGVVLIAFFNLLTDAADMPAIRAASRTPLPAANSRSAFSVRARLRRGLPHGMDIAREAANPWRIRPRRACRKCSAIILLKSNSAAVSIRCSSTHSDTPADRQVSRNDTRSGTVLPTRQTDEMHTRSISPLRIASSSAASPGRRSRTFRTLVGRSVKTCGSIHPCSSAVALRRSIC